MLYCEKCKMLTQNEKCGRCNKRAREPKENDAIFLVTKKGIYSGMLEEMLKRNNIPCIKQPIGVSFAARYMPIKDEHNFFVPFGAYEKAKELADAYFKEID